MSLHHLIMTDHKLRKLLIPIKVMLNGEVTENSFDNEPKKFWNDVIFQIKVDFDKINSEVITKNKLKIGDLFVPKLLVP